MDLIIGNYGSKTAVVDLYVDFLCPYCGKFFAKYGDALQTMLDEQFIVLQIHPLAWIDQYSNGEHYSLRAASAALTIQKHQPEILWKYIRTLFRRGIQPQEAERYDISQGSDENLAKIAKDCGANEESVTEIASGKAVFAPSILQETENLNNSQLISGVPSVFINGIFWEHGNVFTAKILREMFPDMTEFNAEVLAQISQIPCGEVRSYAEITETGLSARAAGTVCKNNPLPLLIPCHRVVRAEFLRSHKTSEVGKYALGGSAAKIALLKAEGVHFIDG